MKGIKVCLEKFRPQTVYMILGMMIGSFYAIMQGPTTLEIPKAAMNIGNFQILACLADVALVAGMQLIKEKSEISQRGLKQKRIVVRTDRKNIHLNRR